MPKHLPHFAHPTKKSLLLAIESSFKFNLTALKFFPSLRAAIGLAIAFVIGFYFFGTTAAISIGLGALLVGVPSVSSSNQRPVRTMIATTIAIAVSAFIATSVTSFWLYLVLLGLISFAGSIVVILGEGATTVGVQTIISFIVFSQFKLAISESFLLLIFISLGGMVQVILIIVAHWSTTLQRQKTALASAYRKLGQAIWGVGQTNIEAGNSLDAAAVSLKSPSLFRRLDVAPLSILLDKGQQLRIELSSLSGLYQQLNNRNNERDQQLAKEIERFRLQSYFLLNEIADSLEESDQDKSKNRSALITNMKEIIKDVQIISSQRIQQQNVHPTEILRFGLINNLVSIVDLLQLISTVTDQAISLHSEITFISTLPGPSTNIFGTSKTNLSRLRANLTFQSSAYRHALRFGSTITIAALIATHSPFARGYWIPLTAALVLKPDFSSTFNQGFARLVGSVLGALVLGFIAEFFHLNIEALIILIVLFSFGAFLFFPVNYTIFTSFITGVVILFVSFENPSIILATTGDRLGNTIIGGIMALVAYILWPSWAIQDLRQSLSELIIAERNYLLQVLKAILGRSNITKDELKGLAQNIRLKRSNTEATMSKASKEPTYGEFSFESAATLLIELRRISQTAHSLRGMYNNDKKFEILSNQIYPVVESINRSLSLMSIFIKSSSGVEPIPSIERLDKNIVESLLSQPDIALFLSQIDTLIDTINSLNILLSNTTSNYVKNRQ